MIDLRVCFVAPFTLKIAAWDDDREVGSISLDRPSRGSPFWLRGSHVVKEYRWRGIARAMLWRAAKVACERYGAEVHVAHEELTDAGVGLWRALVRDGYADETEHGCVFLAIGGPPRIAGN